LLLVKSLLALGSPRWAYFDGIYTHKIGFESTEESVNQAAFKSALIMENLARLLKSKVLR